jgi:hypothetical protein
MQKNKRDAEVGGQLPHRILPANSRELGGDASF